MVPRDPVLSRLRSALDRVYGPRLARVVLFGSRARGDARPDSDYDVAVFLADPGSLWEETGRLADIGADILDDTGAVINALPLPAAAWQDRTLFMRELRTSGVDL